MIFDAHGDILTDVTKEGLKGNDIWQEYHLPMYKQANIKGGIFVNYSDPFNDNQDIEFEQINEYAIPYFKQEESVQIIKNFNDFKSNKINVILGIEGAKALKSADDLERMYELGYRHIGLCWNEENQFASGAFSEGGLKTEGKKLVDQANKLGMLIDYAHLNEQSFYDLASYSQKPIFVSHANVKMLCDHPRNLNDYQLQLIKESNGVVGLSCIGPFLNADKEKVSIDDIVKHIEYIKRTIGITHVGLGLDFCYYLEDHASDNQVEGLKHITDTPEIFKRLKALNYTDEELELIAYKNMLRVIKTSIK